MRNLRARILRRIFRLMFPYSEEASRVPHRGGLQEMAERHSIRGVLRAVRATGWRPGSIIDVGVGTGTEGLYDVWPDATICLVLKQAKMNSALEAVTTST